MIIALIGSPLSGKTTLLKEIKNKDIPVFQADSYITSIYKKGEIGYELIKKNIGMEFVDENFVNKRALAKWTAEGDNLNKLNCLIHPLIKEYLDGKDNFVAELPILTNSPIKFNYDKIILVKASKEVIEERFNNSNIKNPEFIKRIIKDWDKEMNFDYVIDTTNNINLDDINNIISMLNEK